MTKLKHWTYKPWTDCTCPDLTAGCQIRKSPCLYLLRHDSSGKRDHAFPSLLECYRNHCGASCLWSHVLALDPTDWPLQARPGQRKSSPSLLRLRPLQQTLQSRQPWHSCPSSRDPGSAQTAEGARTSGEIAKRAPHAQYWKDIQARQRQREHERASSSNQRQAHKPQHFRIHTDES